RSAARAWSIPRYSATAASTPSATPASRSAWASSGWRCFATASTTSSTTTKAICASWSSSDAALASLADALRDADRATQDAFDAEASPVKVLWSWLLEMCDLDHVPTVEEGARALTRGGIEIEGITDLGAGFTGVVVAEVVGKQPHPHADKLTLVDVITE